MIKTRKFPTIIAIVILALGIIAGVIATNSSTIFKLGASPDSAPQDVRITNISNASITVSWITQKEVVGFVQYGPTASLGQNTVAEAAPSTTHWVNITGLAPSTSYFFKINSDGTVYDNSGIPWTTGTAVALASEPTAQIASGQVQGANSQAVGGVIVYVTPQNGTAVSVLTTGGGAWIVPVSKARTVDLENFVSLTPTTPLQIFVQAGVSGISSAQVFMQNANPVPLMQLGQTYDFRQTGSGSQEETSPTADINLPDSTTSANPSFNLGGASPSATPPTVVTIESIKEKEVISTDSPEFFGKGPANITLTITVQSEIITDTTTTSSTGAWEWTPPQNLEPGTHKLTISWKNAQGILQTITRNFTVEAADFPSFVSTPSASATPSGRHSLPATDSAIPESGDLTPTLIISILGVGLILVSVFIWKFSIQN